MYTKSVWNFADRSSRDNYELLKMFAATHKQMTLAEAANVSELGEGKS